MDASPLQRATRADIPQLLELIRAYHEFDHFDFDEADSRVAVEQLLADETLGRIWFIVENGALVGYLCICFGYSLEFLGRDSFIDEFFLIESARGRGLGTRALQSAVHEIRALGIRALHLEVERENENAQKLYRKLGFEDRRRFFVMSKDLTGVQENGNGI